MSHFYRPNAIRAVVCGRGDKHTRQGNQVSGLATILVLACARYAHIHGLCSSARLRLRHTAAHPSCAHNPSRCMKHWRPGNRPIPHRPSRAHWSSPCCAARPQPVSTRIRCGQAAPSARRMDSPTSMVQLFFTSIHQLKNPPPSKKVGCRKYPHSGEPERGLREHQETLQGTATYSTATLGFQYSNPFIQYSNPPASGQQPSRFSITTLSPKFCCHASIAISINLALT